MELKKSMRGIRDVERKIEQMESKATEISETESEQPKETALESPEAAEAEIAKGYIAAVRALLLEDGDPPLELPGLLIYERAQAIQASLQRCLSKKRA